MKRDTEQMYATMNPWRLFFVVALPGMVSMFSMSIYFIIEGIFIGQKLGEAALAAINIATPLVMINFSIADLIGVGASVPISISLGKKDHDAANNIFTSSIILIFTASVAMGLIMTLAAEPLCRMMGADAELLDTSVRYLRTFAVSGPFCTIFFAMDNFLRISGYVKTSMLINICTNVINVALLVVALVLLQMDVVGSALASSIAMGLASLACLMPFLRGKALLKFTKPRISFKMIKEIVACGSPAFLNNIAGRVAAIMMNVALMTLGVKAYGEGGGTTAVAVYAVLMYSSDLCWPLLYGISDSLAPSIGYNWGADNHDRVKKIVKCAYIGTAVIGFVSTAILFFFPRFIASWFVSTEDTLLLSESARAIRIFCFAYIFRWFGVTTQGFFSAIEKPLFATLMSVSTALVFPVILLVALWPFGLDGIWANFIGVTLLTALLGGALLIRVAREIKAKSENNIKV